MAMGPDAFAACTTAIDDIIVLADRQSRLAADIGIAQRMSGYVQMHAREATGQERAIGNGFIVSDRVDPARFGLFAGLAGQQDALIASALSMQDDDSHRARYERL